MHGTYIQPNSWSVQTNKFHILLPFSGDGSYSIVVQNHVYMAD